MKDNKTVIKNTEKVSRNSQQIKENLIRLSDEKYKEFHSKLCPGTENILGIRVPVLRNYAKEIVKEDWKEYLEESLNNECDEYYEETMLQGMIIGIAKIPIEEFQMYLKKFIPKIDNWAVCDVTISGLKQTSKNLHTMWEFIQKYLQSSKEFELRFAIVMMLDFYIIDDYIDNVLDNLNNIKNDGYYVKMAVAWAISIAFIKYPEKTMQLLKNNKLDDFTFNKSLQKITESYRVIPETKEVIRKMKRK